MLKQIIQRLLAALFKKKGKAVPNTNPNAKQITFVPSGSISATDVQTAIEEVAAEAGASSPIVTSIKSAPYNAIGDGTTDDSAAFTLAEAASVKIFYLPAGTYNVTGVTLTKRYYGEGRLFLNGEYYGQNYSSITSGPVSTDPGNYGIDGDITHVEVGSFRLAAGARNGLGATYFNAPTTPKFTRYDTSAGNGGMSARITQNATAGATTVYVNAVPTNVTNGTVIQISGTVTETVTVSSTGAGTITFSPALANAVAAGGIVTTDARTMNQYEFCEVYHRGGGDSYCWTGRMVVTNANNRQMGQDHFFYTATGGVIGGDLAGAEDGVYLTSTEFNSGDTTFFGSKDISAIGHVNSFQRSVDPRAAITTTLSAGASSGAYAVSVTSAAGFLSSGGTLTITGIASSETHYIASVVGTTVNLIEPLNYTYPSNATVTYQAQAYRTTLSAPASFGASTIAVADTTGILPGSTVLTIIQGQAISVNTVTSVVGPNIGLGNTLGATFTSGAAVSVTNTTITPYGNTWQGAIYKSEASKACDAVISVLGKWKTGINLTNADFSSFNNAAIMLKTGHRIYFNSYTAYDVGGFNLWGNVVGDTYIGQSAQSGRMEHFVANKIVFGYLSDKFSSFVQTEVSNNFAVTSGKNVYFDGLSGNNYTFFDGSYIRHRAGGVSVLSLNNSEVNVNAQLYVGNGLYFYNFTNTSSATSGPAAALPATPYTYLTIYLNGLPYKLPLYNV